jgi:hypothetical protein
LLGDLLAFGIPSLMFLEFDIVGRLFLPEVMLLGLFLLLLPLRWRRLTAKWPKWLIVLMLSWLFAQIVTDAIRATPFHDWARGWSKIAFLTLNFSALYMLLSLRRSRMIIFASGVALGQILEFFITPNIYAEGDPWKFGVGHAVTLVAVLCTQTRVFRVVPLATEALLTSVALLNLQLGFRSLALICVATLAFVLVQRYSKVLSTRRRINFKVIGTLGLVIVAGVAAAQGYEYIALKGWLGDEVREKYELQSSGTFGILLGGRAELLGSTQAIIDSPIIGHGSWAKNPTYAALLVDQLLELGYESPQREETDLIPTHSYLLGAWVESGIIGAIFWFFVLAFLLKVLLFLFRTRDAISPLAAFVIFELTWNILFSPFGAEARFNTAFYLVLLVSVFSTLIFYRASNVAKKQGLA